jgi:Tfp pilus assembly protein PilO
VGRGLRSDGAGRQDASWESLQGLQEVAQRVGLSVEELRPTLLKGRRGEPNRLRLEVKLRGQLAAMSQFLEQIPEVVSGIQLDHVRLSPHKEFGAQGLFRLSVAEA